MAKDMTKANRTAESLSKEVNEAHKFILQHWKRYVYLVIGIVAATAAILYFYETKEKGNIKESQEIYTARTTEELEQVIKQYPDSKSVDYSRLELAAKYFDSKEYDKAIAVYQDEVKNGKDEFAKELAQLNKCYITAEKGDEKTAVSEFRKLADNNKMPELIRAEAAYAAGNMLIKINEKDEALKYLNLCITFKNCQGWSKFAKSLIDTNV